MTAVLEPTREQILAFCAEEPVERVFLEDVARRGHGRFAGVEDEQGRLLGLCHLGTNVVPSGRRCAAFATLAVKTEPRMLIGEERAVSELWEASRRRFGEPRDDRPGQPVYEVRVRPSPGESAVRAATPDDLDVLVPACAAAHELEIGINPLRRDPNGFRWRTRAQIEAGRSWVWREGDRILFKAEASAWTPRAVQLQQVWTDPELRGQGYAGRGLRDLVGLLLDRVAAVCLFVRTDNPAAIALYDSIGMRRVLHYRSVLL